ncbi:MAG: OmpA family protein [Luteibaculaceae bacterium]
MLFRIIPLIFIGVCLACFSAVAQEDCSMELNKKAEKLLAKGSDKKIDISKRQTLLQQAYQADENCLECLFLMGVNSYKLANMAQRGFGNSKKIFNELYSKCPTYHADLLYYLGLFAYIDKEYELCYRYFNELYDFFKSVDDNSKFPKDWDKKFGDVKEVMPEVEFFATFYQNPVPFTPEVLANASSSADEYLPSFSPDNSLLFYTREKLVQEFNDPYPRKVEFFTVSKRKGKQFQFDSGEALPSPFNVGFNYGGMTLSADNKEMYITICKPIPGKEYKNCDIYRTFYKIKQTDEGEALYGWSEPENLGPNINTPLGWESQPSLSGDGMTLYFAVSRESTKGIDIFYSERQADGSWGKAKPLSEVVNTKGNEKAPFIHSDSRTLYFASNGHYGAGGYDLFYTKQDEKGNWSTPKNLGHPINSEVDEHGLVVSANGNKAVFSTNRFSQNKKTLDLVSFSLPESLKPDEVLLIDGLLTDENNSPLQDFTLEITSTNGEEVATNIKITGDEQGRYSTMVRVPNNREIILQVKKEGFAFEAKKLTIPNVKDKVSFEPLSIEEEAVITKIEKGKPFVIKDIKYKTNSAEIESSSLPILEAFVRYLDANKDLTIEIRGHTDNIGSKQANLNLSTERAFNVLEFLQERGIDGKRLKYKGFGDTLPLGDNATEQGRAKNRRTEFVVL